MPQYQCSIAPAPPPPPDFDELPDNHREHIGVRDQFRLGGLRSEYFLHCLPENQVGLPEYYMFFCPKMAIWNILGGLQPPAPPPRLVRLCRWEVGNNFSKARRNLAFTELNKNMRSRSHTNGWEQFKPPSWSCRGREYKSVQCDRAWPIIPRLHLHVKPSRTL